MPRLDWSPAALRDLQRIDAWVSDNVSAAMADRMLSAIRARAVRLEQFPMIGRRLLDREFRVLTVPGTPYLLVYRVTGEVSQILRVRHERQDWVMEP